jgi:hypothetical protein
MYPERDGAGPLDLLLGLFGCKQRGKDQPQHKGRNGQERNGCAYLAEL